MAAGQLHVQSVVEPDFNPGLSVCLSEAWPISRQGSMLLLNWALLVFAGIQIGQPSYSTCKIEPPQALGAVGRDSVPGPPFWGTTSDSASKPVLDGSVGHRQPSSGQPHSVRGPVINIP